MNKIFPPEPLVMSETALAKANRWRKRHKKKLVIASAGFGVFALAGLGLVGYGAMVGFTPEYIPPAITAMSDFDGQYTSLGNGPVLPKPTQDENNLPSIVLGGSGGEAELDQCDGSFIRMTGYEEVNGLQPTYAAHNKCNGGQILELQIDSRILIDGEEYKVVGTRDLPREGSNATQLLGLEGELILQSCFYNSKWMHFISVVPLVSNVEEMLKPSPSPTPDPSLTPTP